MSAQRHILVKGCGKSGSNADRKSDSPDAKEESSAEESSSMRSA